MISKICIATGILALIATILIWITQGANKGWTQTKIPEVKVDPITEIQYTEYTEGFKPGVEFLLIGVISGIGAVGLGILLANRPGRKSPDSKSQPH